MKSIIILGLVFIASTVAHEYYAPPPKVEVVKPTEILEKHVEVVKEQPIVELIKPTYTKLVPIYKSAPQKYIETYLPYGGYGYGGSGYGSSGYGDYNTPYGY